MTSKILILNNSNQAIIGEIEVADAKIYERINDKYTFDFTCYEQKDTNLLAQSTLIYADEDYFRIASIREYPVEKKFEVSCEHISYELNVITPEEAEEDAVELHYEGFTWDIIPEMLEGTRFEWLPSDENNEWYEFSTKSKGIRSRIIEFCQKFGLEVHWRRFEVATQNRRGHDHGLVIELGENLKDLTINKTFNFDGTIDQTYDIDFIDLNKILDENGDPLKENEFHMGDTVHLKIRNRLIAQRGVAVGYNPFRRELPTIELESPVRDILNVIADGAVDRGNGSGGGGNDYIEESAIMETARGDFSEGMTFVFTKEYDNVYSVTLASTKPITEDGNVYYELVKNRNKFIGVKVLAIKNMDGTEISMMAVVK